MTLYTEDNQFCENNAPEVGLSSAMHDIRRLAASYKEEQVNFEKGLTQARLSSETATLDPRLLLIPRAAPRGDGWRVTALMLMMMLGLSTSAVALMLFRDAEPTVHSQAQLSLPSDDSGIARVTVMPEAALEARAPTEAPLYTLPSVPERRLDAPETHEVRAPISRGRRSLRSRPASEEVGEVASSCDEVACLIDSDDPCCEQFESVKGLQVEEPESISRPYRLTRAEAMGPMQGIRGRVRRCFDAHGYEGVATVKIVIAPEGTVQRFNLGDGTPSFQKCVQEQVETLQFPELSQPFTLSYPYTLR